MCRCGYMDAMSARSAPPTSACVRLHSLFVPLASRVQPYHACHDTATGVRLRLLVTRRETVGGCSVAALFAAWRDSPVSTFSMHVRGSETAALASALLS
jgi:hypothetical protein